MSTIKILYKYYAFSVGPRATPRVQLPCTAEDARGPGPGRCAESLRLRALRSVRVRGASGSRSAGESRTQARHSSHTTHCGRGGGGVGDRVGVG